jgi:glutathione-specific gamma-glutamylcyclotransferase
MIASERRFAPGEYPACPTLPPGDLWIFAYGSLMWDPGFPHAESMRALLRGYHRTFCIYSHRYRGTPEQPGLVLGLDRGGACRGLVFRVVASAVNDVLGLLWGREMPQLTYRPRMVCVDAAHSKLQALAFIADPKHPSYAGRLSDHDIALRVAHSKGARGANIDYLANTLRHLDQLGMRDARLHRIYSAVQALAAGSD